MKKTLAVLAVVILVCSMAVGGTYAYLQDDDSARNVMAVGNVQIVQNEKEADLETDFVQNKPMIPAVFTEEITGENIITKDETTGENIFNPAINNVVDKFVSVTNNGNQSVFVRTIIAFEGTYEEHDRLVYVNGTYDYIEDENGNVIEVELNGTTYCLAVCYYNVPLEADETSSTSLRQVFFAPHATNEDMVQFGATYDILCLSQAVQVAGFEELGAEFALNTAFGDIAANAATWLSGIAG